MARKSQAVSLDFAFFTHLHQFYTENKGRIRRHYRELSKKYLDYNDPENSNSFLRQPQFEALEMYVFLKEYLNNDPIYRIFKDWWEMSERFEGRRPARVGAQMGLFESVTKDQYENVFKQMQAYGRIYPNYIFALTMGTGKTILMATCIFYEFLLANKFPKDPKYCHNALVFAPDKTVLQSLREIQTFDMNLVVPPEYVNFLTTHIKFHFLEESGATLSVLDKSRFNIIISNVQKVILKRQHKDKTPQEKLFQSSKPTYDPGTVYDEFADLYGFDEPEDEKDLTTNQRFEKLRRLEQLGIYIDEAHHLFGRNLARDVGAKKDTRKTSLRNTIDHLALSLKRTGTQVVACYNYTGTPYVGKEVLPEVVYAFGLQDAIDEEYLKKVRIHGYTNPKSSEFIDIVIGDFWEKNGGDRRHEGMRPKIAFFASRIDELQEELRPAVEKALAKRGIPTSKILVNVGDDKITSNDDIREFNRLDTFGSDKQFILLVNKGREGWNCRSLFGVALFRKPKSKIFVLQATMRCLRSIGEVQNTGEVYLSAENVQILEDELQQNFRVSLDDVTGAGTNKDPYKVRVKVPPKKIKLKRIRKQYNLEEKELHQGLDLELDQADTERYRLIHTEQDGLVEKRINQVEDLTHLREKRVFTPITLVAEISRYLNKPCLEIEKILESTKQGTDKILEYVNRFNELLYDWVIPRLFAALYEISEDEKTEEYEVELVKVPEDKDYYEVSAAEDLVVSESDAQAQAPNDVSKSFHLDTYCFDSSPERELFWYLLKDKRVKQLYFTGMLTHGQSEFFIQYIDPESHTVRSYYPDFLMQKKESETFVIVEVKGDNKIDDPIVLAKKEFAEQIAGASNMTYRIIKGKDAENGNYAFLFDEMLSSHGQLEYINEFNA